MNNYNKRAAIFGIDFEPLRKQFGELFLAKRQSEAPNGANGSGGKGRTTLFKHAAMFGLDARIALAIFGALSVISGAALYSAIQNAKAVALINYFAEVVKAEEAYYLDTGRVLSYNSQEVLRIGLLSVDDGVTGWNGPYFNFTNLGLGYNATHLYTQKEFSTGGNIINRLILRSNDDWSGDIYDVFIGNTNNCAGGTVYDCSQWVTLMISNNTPKADKLAKKIDEMIDNLDGGLAGNFRFGYNTAETIYYIFYKGRSSKRDSLGYAE